jgi:hypothetical protein
MKELLSKLKYSILKIIYNLKESGQNIRKKPFRKPKKKSHQRNSHNKDKDNYPPETIYPLW